MAKEAAMRWLGALAGLVLVVALIGGASTIAYQMGLDSGTTGQIVQTGAEGGTVIVRDGHYGHFGPPFGFFGFFIFLLLGVLLFKALAFGFWRGGGGGWGGGRGHWEDEARRRHNEWHAGAGQAATPGSEPSSAAGEPR